MAQMSQKRCLLWTKVRSSSELWRTFAQWHSPDSKPQTALVKTLGIQSSGSWRAWFSCQIGLWHAWGPIQHRILNSNCKRVCELEMSKIKSCLQWPWENQTSYQIWFAFASYNVFKFFKTHTIYMQQVRRETWRRWQRRWRGNRATWSRSCNSHKCNDDLCSTHICRSCFRAVVIFLCRSRIRWSHCHSIRRPRRSTTTSLWRYHIGGAPKEQNKK